MPTCTALKCCANLWCCDYTNRIKSRGVKVRRKNVVVRDGRRGSVFVTKQVSDDVEKNNTILLKYEPDNGVLWNACHWFGRWLFSANVASFLIWILSIVFLSIHLQNYKNNCDLTTKFVLDEEVKQVWSNPNVNRTYEDECSFDSNPIIGNVTNILIFLLTLALGAGLDKYKETLRLYEEIAGDIKAMAMLLVHLTFDGEKYYLKGDTLCQKENVEETYRKMKYLLSSLAPTVKNTIAGGEYTVQYRGDKCSCPKITCSSKLFSWSNPFEALSDRKYFEVINQNTCEKIFFSSTIEYPNYWKDAKEQVENKEEFKILEAALNFGEPTLKTDRQRLFYLVKSAGKELNAEVQYSLYRKIKDIRENTEMDAFECSMTVLMDELMRLFENQLGFGADEGSAIASAAIDRWNAIYGTWGTLSSLKTYSEPVIVNMFRCALIGVYSWFMPKSYLKYHGVIDEGWLYIFVAGDMFIFCLMWWLAFAVRNPFKNSFIIRNVSKLAYQTQYQVQQLMANRVKFDRDDYNSSSKYGYINKGNKTIGIDIFKDDERSVEDILADSLKKRNESASSKQKELNEIIKKALNKLNEETKDRDIRLEEIVGEILRALLPPPPPPAPPAPTENKAGLRRRGLNF